MPTDYGRTIAYPIELGDAYPDLRPVDGVEAVRQSIYRRFETSLGTLSWARGDGFNLRSLILDNEPDVRDIKRRVERECLKDERVSQADATVRWNRRTRVLTIEIDGTCGAGPFRLVVSPTDLTAELLSG